MINPLLQPVTLRLIEAAVSAHLGSSWRVNSTADLADRSSHPAMILSDRDLARNNVSVCEKGFAVFAKLADRSEARAQLDSESDGLRLIAELAGVAVPTMIGSGRLDLPDGSAVLLLEALDERIDRGPADWRAIGRSLALLHQVSGDTYGADRDGFFGPLRQDNRPVASNRWTDFYVTRRIMPYLRTARDAGSVDSPTAARIERLAGRLDEFVGPDPQPRLLHGDAQHHNFVSTPTGAVVIDASPYFGHPEVDLALLDYFSPVPDDTWAGYTEIRPIDPGFAERRELWRIFAYLAILTVDADSDFGRSFRARLSTALDRYVGTTGAASSPSA